LSGRGVERPNFEGQFGAALVGTAEANALAVTNVEHGYSPFIHEHPVSAAIVDGHPSPLIEAENEM
jgi:hypothetical protein